MLFGMTPQSSKVAEIYNWIDSMINNADPAISCCACGKCCDFDTFGHRLFITSIEMRYFVEVTGTDNLKLMTAEICPYNIDKKCTVHNHRFAGCRIFNCKADSGLQNLLSESALGLLKKACIDHNIPYLYSDLKTALNHAADICR